MKLERHWVSKGGSLMEKNGKFFVSVVEEKDFNPSVWDPYVYKKNGTQSLSDFADVQKPRSRKENSIFTPFEAIEYRNIPAKNYLTFTLVPKLGNAPKKQAVVSEGELLFGTMRAYLGNALVTPIARWLNHKSSIGFQVKSEFVVILPYDNLHYFWLAYMRSKQFLENLPLGSGGTRPRLQLKALLQTPVVVPDLDERKRIHDQLKALAKEEWEKCLRIASISNSIEASI